MRIINFNDGFTSAAAPTVQMPASTISVTPSGNLTSTDAQSAFVELQGDSDTYATHVANMANPHAVTKAQVGLSAVTNDAQVKVADKGVALGVAPLDATAKIDISYMPTAILGANIYQGTWNALTNTPTLVTSTGSKGYFYYVSSAGTTNLNGITDWQVNDIVIFNGSAWQKIDNTDAVQSVAGRTGAVVLTSTDVGLANVDNTSDVTKNAAAVVLTNKDHDGGTASNTSRLTVPKAALATLNALTRKQGTLVYDTTANALLADDGTNLNQIGSGSGEKNYITAPSTASAWTVTGTITAATVTTGLPRLNTTKTGTSFTSGAVADYARSRFILDAADYNKKLKIQFDQVATVGTDWKIDVYGSTDSGATYTVRLPLSTDSAAVSKLPGLTGTFRTTFDSPGTLATSYIEVRITRVANSSALVLSDVVVGPGVVQQGAAVTETATFTPTTINLGAGSSTNTLKWYRVGDSLYGSLTIAKDATPGTGTGYVGFSLPTGLTVDSAKLINTGGTANIGSYNLVASNAYGSDGPVSYQAANGLSNIVFGKTGTSAYVTGATMTASSVIMAQFIVPIAEWAGSGTVNVVQNEITFAAYDTTAAAMVYGQNGAILPTVFPANVAVTWPTPTQSGDIEIVEFKYTGNDNWVPAGHLDSTGGLGIDLITQRNSKAYGVGLFPSSGSQTITRVYFGDYCCTDPASATYTAVGKLWSALPAAMRYRVRRISGGQAVGFSEVQPGVSSGLVSANGLKGVATNSAAPTGYVGEYLEVKASAASVGTTAQYFDAGTLTLTAGDWDVSAMIVYDRNGATLTSPYIEVGVSTVSGNSSSGLVTGVTKLISELPTAAVPDYMTGTLPTVRVQNDGTNLYINGGTLSSTQIIYLKGYIQTYSAATPKYNAILRARRVR
jgi:hypothetical protein